MSIKDISLLKVNDDTVSILKRWINNAKNHKDNIYELSDADYIEYKQITANALRESIDKIDSILAKKAFL